MEELNTPLLMFIAYRHAENAIFEGLAAAGYDDVTLAQGRLFARIRDEGSRVTELAESAQVTKQTAGYLVDQLVRLGYVERVPDPRDARARLVVPSAKGEEVREAAREIEKRIEDQWRAHLGTRRYTALREAMVALREVTDPWV